MKNFKFAFVFLILLQCIPQWGFAEEIHDPQLALAVGRLKEHFQKQYWSQCDWDEQLFRIEPTENDPFNYYSEIICSDSILSSKIGLWFNHEIVSAFYAEGYAVNLTESWNCRYNGEFNEHLVTSQKSCIQLESLEPVKIAW